MTSFHRHFKPITSLMATLLLITCAGCLKPYRVDLKQGKQFDGSIYDQIEPGMTEQDVRQRLGNPIIQDVFHPDRWEYLYILRSDRQPNQQQHFTVWFENGRVVTTSRLK